MWLVQRDHHQLIKAPTGNSRRVSDEAFPPTFPLPRNEGPKHGRTTMISTQLFLPFSPIHDVLDMWRLLSSLSTCSLFLGLVVSSPTIPGSLVLPFRRAEASEQPHSTRLQFSTDGDPFQFGRVDYGGDGQTVYIATVYVEGQPFPVCDYL